MWNYSNIQSQFFNISVFNFNNWLDFFNESKKFICFSKWFEWKVEHKKIYIKYLMLILERNIFNLDLMGLSLPSYDNDQHPF